jgi:hypothetical protein
MLVTMRIQYQISCEVKFVFLSNLNDEITWIANCLNSYCANIFQKEPTGTLFPITFYYLLNSAPQSRYRSISTVG